MRPGLPKLVKDAQRVRAMVEESFVRMARRHRYSTGADIRAAAKAIVLLALRAWRQPENRIALAADLCDAVDVLKVELQLGKDVGAFRSFAEFEAIVRLTIEVGRQSGGWLKGLRSAGQNAPGREPLPQRAPTLSSRSAPLAGAAP